MKGVQKLFSRARRVSSNLPNVDPILLGGFSSGKILRPFFIEKNFLHSSSVTPQTPVAEPLKTGKAFIDSSENYSQIRLIKHISRKEG